MGFKTFGSYSGFVVMLVVWKLCLQANVFSQNGQTSGISVMDTAPASRLMGTPMRR